MIKEAIIHQQVCDYLRLRHPNVIFRTDFAAGVKMTFGQAARHKRLQSSRAYPDLFIAEPRGGYHGLFIELKATTVYKRDGVTLLTSPHIFEQAAMLKKLGERGYYAVFGIGFDETVGIINKYLKTS